MTDDPQMIYEHGEPTGHTSWGPDPEEPVIEGQRIRDLEARIRELEAELLDLNTASWQRVAHHHCDARINALQARVAELEAEVENWRRVAKDRQFMAQQEQAEAEKLRAELDDAPSVSQYTQLQRERDETRKQRDAYRTRAEKAEAELDEANTLSQMRLARVHELEAKLAEVREARDKYRTRAVKTDAELAEVEAERDDAKVALVVETERHRLERDRLAEALKHYRHMFVSDQRGAIARSALEDQSPTEGKP